jgi:hypothetical protein
MKLEQSVSAKPKYWHELTEEEKKAIHNPKDYPVISVIKAIPQDILNKLDKTLFYLSESKNYKLFMDEELPWLEDFLWYKGEGQKNGVSWDRMCAEYRAYFAAEHPERIEDPSIPEIKSFLEWIATGREYYKSQAS